MKTHEAFLVCAACALLAGCVETRSISRSGYRDISGCAISGSREMTEPGFAYQGELSEFDVLGVSRNQTAFEEDIQAALDKARPVRLKPGGTILLIQSGAVFPDGPMVAQLSTRFTVVPFSGVPPRKNSFDSQQPGDRAGLSRSLRLAAARAGAETVLCYWGILESAREKMATKTVSWVPLVTWFVPDEREHMRIRLKLALIDVRTGSWSVLSPTPIDSTALSVGTRRPVADQKLVERLKDLEYRALVEELLKVYAARILESQNTL